MNLENVGDKIGNSVYFSVNKPAWDSVWKSVSYSVRFSAWDSVVVSVWDSVDIGIQNPIREERKQG